MAPPRLYRWNFLKLFPRNLLLCFCVQPPLIQYMNTCSLVVIGSSFIFILLPCTKRVRESERGKKKVFVKLVSCTQNWVYVCLVSTNGRTGEAHHRWWAPSRCDFRRWKQTLRAFADNAMCTTEWVSERALKWNIIFHIACVFRVFYAARRIGRISSSSSLCYSSNLFYSAAGCWLQPF